MQGIQALLIFTFLGTAVCDVYKPFFLREEVRNPEKPPCNDYVLMGYLAAALITTPEDIVGIAITDFESACGTTSAVIRNIDKYFEECVATANLFLYLINGLRAFDEKLCKNNAFYKKYDIYDQCISGLDRDFDSCNGVPDWNEMEDEEKVCKIYKSIVDCYYLKTSTVCGTKAALTLKELMIDVIDNALTVKCNIGSNPTVNEAMPVKNVQSLNQVSLQVSSGSRNIYIQHIIGYFLVINTILFCIYLIYCTQKLHVI